MVSKPHQRLRKLKIYCMKIEDEKLKVSEIF